MSFWRSRRTLWTFAGAVVVVLLLWRPGAGRFRFRLEQSLGSALGQKVEIGSVSVQILPRPGFNLSQFSVRDDPQFSLEPILRADEVSATLHPSSIWRWRIEIATLSFKDASLNLVRRGDGHWNLEPFLERAAHAPAAPTGNSTAEVRRRFPYIEVTNGRVNLKLGAEKMPYALTEADLALFLESNDEWGMRLRGQPVRTDMRLSDTGILRANATWQRASDLRKTPLQLTATYEGAQLGQLSKLLSGAEKVWRGTVRASVNLNGSAEDLEIQSTATVDNFRRYDIMSGPSLRLATTCSARYSSSPRQFSEILCSSPYDDGSLLLRGKIGLLKPPVYDLNLNAAKFPAQRLADLLRGVKKGLPEDLSASGSVNADISFEADGAGTTRWSGGGKTDHLSLRSAALETKDSAGILELGSVPFRAVSKLVTTGKQPRTAGNSQPFGNAVEVGPLSVNLGKQQTATFHARFALADYDVTFGGEGTIQRLLQIGRAAGFTSIYPAMEGDAKFDWQAKGSWGGLTPSQTNGAIAVRDARVEFPGMNVPVEITAVDASLTPDSLKLDKLVAATGGIHWTGTIVRPRLCPNLGSCATQIDLHTDEVSLEKLNLLLNPNIHKEPWYRILTGSPRPGSTLLSQNIQGRIVADRLLVGDVVAEDASTQLKLENGHLHLSELRASIFGGHQVGDCVADFSKDAPGYTVTGAFENISLLQFGKLMHSPWISGSARGTYELTLAGGSAAELQNSQRGSMTLDARDGALTRFGAGANSLSFQHLTGTLTTGKSLVVISQGKLQNAQGIYEVSGVASFARKLDLTFERRDGHKLAITGNLEIPHVEATAAEPYSAKNHP